MFKRNKKPKLEIDEILLKRLKMFEETEARFNSAGYTVTYLRVPGGIVRTVSHPDAMSQLFIPLQNTYFTTM